eukprot:15294219-Alexandrium_andersonii.AAC.1
MSASLVGSEMCIRDSSLAARWVSSTAARPAPHSGPLKTWRSTTINAVSYTHLTLPTICSV